MTRLNELKHPLVIAHRGFRQKYPENTLVSFEAAVREGVEMIELDVTLTQDRKMVIIHDDTLDRTTNGKGNVSDHPLSELKKLDAGSWFSPGFKGERLPTLEDVLDAFAGKVAINIEIKKSAHEPLNPLDAIEKQVLDLLERKNVMDSVLISSFEKNVLFRIRELNAHVPISFLTEIPPYDEITGILKKLSAYSWNPDYRTILYAHVQKMRYAGFHVIPFTINTPIIAKKFIEAGIHGFFTDDPTIMA
ncbi:MAG: glycerophosphodiester phosphodiesterase [Proteobacteria bacterium]|nr:glycerophosphodiester phosphodiesterase [Pseudomonadota bacterium]